MRAILCKQIAHRLEMTIDFYQDTNHRLLLTMIGVKESARGSFVQKARQETKEFVWKNRQGSGGDLKDLSSWSGVY